MTVSEALLSVYQVSITYIICDDYCTLEVPMAVLSHTVVNLAVHEPNKEMLYWKDGDEQAKMAALQKDKPTSQLTAFFALCRSDPNARNYTYPEITEHYL